MIGQTISHYKITEKLGGGGMGVVYRAIDTKLDRPVALKFLPPELTRDLDAKRRFVHEAKAASALQHNNICTIHEIDETQDGHVFIAMDCYEGETLMQRVAKGPLPVDEAIDIACQVAEGLSKAHEAGMVHRDIKPANIVITNDGVAKIVDFGLAKLAGQTKITKTGMTVGTVAYMSPEQATGKDVDPRSDIFSLGSVIYEMLTGHVPFKGDHEAAVLYGVTHNDPDPLTKFRTSVPEELQEIVKTALQKEPNERYQSASEIARDLTRLRKGVPLTGFSTKSRRTVWLRSLAISAVFLAVALAAYLVYSNFVSPGTKGTEIARRMIAVLPFNNLGPTEDDYFADGITDAITARLAAVHGLGVISRQSAIQYKGTKKSLREIGDELGVEFILEGTIQRERPTDPTSRIRVIPQLIRVSDDTHLWAESYDDEMREVFQIQSDIAGDVAQALDVVLLAAERRALDRKPTHNMEAYEYYLRGWDYAYRHFNLSDAVTAVEMFSKAVKIDPEFSNAWAELSQGRMFLYFYYGMTDELEKAVEAANIAERLAPELGETHMALGYVQYYGNRAYDEALKHFMMVEESQPSNTHALNSIGHICKRKGEWRQAVAKYTQVMELDPRDGYAPINLALCLMFIRDFRAAERVVGRVISINPSSLALPYELKSLLCVMKAESLSVCQQIIQQALTSLPAGDWEAGALNWSIRPTLIRLMPELYEEVLAQAPREGPPIVNAQGLLYRAELDLQKGRVQFAMARCDSIRVLLEPLLEEDPDNAMAHCLLGMAYSRMGLNDQAIAEASTTTKLVPLAKDAYSGAEFLGVLAEVYVRAGEYEAALDQLEYLTSVPSLVSFGLLNRDPVWEPLRDQPRYQRLAEKQSQIDS